MTDLEIAFNQVRLKDQQLRQLQADLKQTQDWLTEAFRIMDNQSENIEQLKKLLERSKYPDCWNTGGRLI